jgi:hypothetical protein
MTSIVVVPDRLLSLAIGREGQNARLAAKLTGWKVDIKSSTEIEIERMKQQIDGDLAERTAVPAEAAAEALEEAVAAEELPAVADLDEAAVAAAAAASEAAVMAELQAEEAAAEAARLEAAQAASTLTAEEMLARESLGIDEQGEEEIVVEAIDSDDVFKVLEPVGGGPQIRFAEDILGAPQPRRATGRRRGGNRGPARPPRPARNGPQGGADNARPSRPEPSIESSSTPEQ